MKNMKIRNWHIYFEEPNGSSVITGLLMYEGKIIPRWGYGMCFTIDENSTRYDYPEVVPAYIKNRLESIRKRLYL